MNLQAIAGALLLAAACAAPAAGAEPAACITIRSLIPPAVDVDCTPLPPCVVPSALQPGRLMECARALAP